METSEDEAADYQRNPGEPFVIPEVKRFAGDYFFFFFSFSIFFPLISYNLPLFVVSWPYQFAYLMQRQIKNLIRTPQTSIFVVFQVFFFFFTPPNLLLHLIFPSHSPAHSSLFLCHCLLEVCITEHSMDLKAMVFASFPPFSLGS